MIKFDVLIKLKKKKKIMSLYVCFSQTRSNFPKITAIILSKDSIARYFEPIERS